MTRQFSAAPLPETGYHLPRNGGRILWMRPPYVNRKIAPDTVFFCSAAIFGKQLKSAIYRRRYRTNKEWPAPLTRAPAKLELF
jgi:hypothetical protein